MTPPWPGLGAYAVTKAALDKLVEAWREEHPSVGFTRVIVGDCTGGEGDGMTQFANNWNADLAMEVGTDWVTRGYIAGNLMPVEELVTRRLPRDAVRRDHDDPVRHRDAAPRHLTSVRRHRPRSGIGTGPARLPGGSAQITTTPRPSRQGWWRRRSGRRP